MGVTALQAAKHACEASGWTLTNLQLQKILYLAHMIYVGRHDNPLVADEAFEAWNYGPVLPSVYHTVSAFGSGPIKNIFRSVPSIDGGEIASLIEDTVERFAPMPPFKLVELTHDDRSAWSRHYSSDLRGVQIPKSSIREEYRNRFGRGN